MIITTAGVAIINRTFIHLLMHGNSIMMNMMPIMTESFNINRKTVLKQTEKCILAIMNWSILPNSLKCKNRIVVMDLYHNPRYSTRKRKPNTMP